MTWFRSTFLYSNSLMYHFLGWIHLTKIRFSVSKRRVWETLRWSFGTILRFKTWSKSKTSTTTSSHCSMIRSLITSWLEWVYSKLGCNIYIVWILSHLLLKVRTKASRHQRVLLSMVSIWTTFYKLIARHWLVFLQATTSRLVLTFWRSCSF